MTCPTPTKKRHATEARAWQHVAALRSYAHASVDLQPYSCKCGFWHVGHSKASLAFRTRKAFRAGRA